MIITHEPSVEKWMKDFYENLPENQKRRYATIEANKLGYGGVKYISELFSCDTKTIYNGRKELKLEEEQVSSKKKL
jgi:hypothetical protein